MMETQQVIRQPYNSAYCSFYAIVNLYRALQLPPPDLEKMFDIDPLGARTGEQPLANVWRMLCLLAFPGLCYMGLVPVGTTLEQALAAHIEQGDTVLLYYISDWEGERYRHLGLLERCYPDGVDMYCSVMGKAFLPYVMLSPEWLDREQELLPVVEIRPARDLRGVAIPLGIVRAYLAVSLFKQRPEDTLVISLNGGNGNGNGKRI
jgi:hypothetical protein